MRFHSLLISVPVELLPQAFYMPCYLVTGEFFADEMIPVPKLTFQETPSNLQTCMCVSREFSRRNEGAGIEKQHFTLRIICRSEEALNAAGEVQKRYQGMYEFRKMGRPAQRAMFFKLKSICDCHPSSSTSSTPPPYRTPVRTFSQASSSGPSARSTTSIPPTNGSKKKKKKKTSKSSPTGAKAPAGKRQSPFQATCEPNLTAMALSKLPSTDRKSIINGEIAKLVRDNIDAPYQERGSIYWIDSPSNPGYLLLGYTLSGSPEYIHDDVKHCLKDARLIAYTSLVPNVQRIMHLVMAELVLYARDLGCTICGTRHNGWYDITPDAAERTVLNWARWMLNVPYENCSGHLEQKWKFRTEYSKLADLESASLASYNDEDTTTWAWWTGLSQLDSPRDPVPLSPVEVRRISG